MKINYLLNPFLFFLIIGYEYQLLSTTSNNLVFNIEEDQSLFLLDFYLQSEKDNNKRIQYIILYFHCYFYNKLKNNNSI